MDEGWGGTGRESRAFAFTGKCGVGENTASLQGFFAKCLFHWILKTCKSGDMNLEYPHA